MFGLIGRRNGDENGLVETTADELDLAVGDELAQKIQELRVVLLTPFEQRAGVMQTHAYGRMPGDGFDEGQIGALIGLFKDAVEVTRRLMAVDH